MATQPSVHEAKEALDHVNEEERKANADRVLETAEKNKVKPAKLDRSRVRATRLHLNLIEYVLCLEFGPDLFHCWTNQV